MATATVSDTNSAKWLDSASASSCSTNELAVLSQQVLEVIKLPTSQLAVLSQQVLEVIKLPTSTLAILSQQVLEVIIATNERQVSDDLNNWNDAASASLGDAFLKLEVTISDNLNTSVDSISLFLGYCLKVDDDLDNLDDSLLLFFGLVLEDTLLYWDDEVNLILHIESSLDEDDLNVWNDEINLILGLEFEVNDDLNNYDDTFDLLIGDGLELDDSLDNWDDALLLHFGLILEDTLLYWDDEVIAFGPRGLGVSDNLNSNIAWRDSVRYSTNLILLSLEDEINFRDGLTLNYYADDPIVEVDLILDLLDSKVVNLGLCIAVDDTLVFGDLLEYISDIPFEVSDDLNNWDDEVLFDYRYPIIVSDNLNHWLDVILLRRELRESVSDGLDLSSDVLLRLDTFLSLSDSLTLLDTILLKFSQGIEVDDDLNSWDDKVSTDAFVLLVISVSDALSLNDSITVYISLDLIVYIRRYLNDSFYPTPIPIFVKVGYSLDNVAYIEYIRRYLDDVQTASGQIGDLLDSSDAVEVTLT